MQKGINLGAKIEKLKLWGYNRAIVKLKGLKSNNWKLNGQNYTIIKLWGTKLHFKLFLLFIYIL
jgi:hypothetical protein